MSDRFSLHRVSIFGLLIVVSAASSAFTARSLGLLPYRPAPNRVCPALAPEAMPPIHELEESIQLMPRTSHKGKRWSWDLVHDRLDQLERSPQWLVTTARKDGVRISIPARSIQGHQPSIGVAAKVAELLKLKMERFLVDPNEVK